MGQRRGAGALEGQVEDRSTDGQGVHARMRPEALVLGCDGGLEHHRCDLVKRNGDAQAAGRVALEHDARRVEHDPARVLEPIVGGLQRR